MLPEKQIAPPAENVIPPGYEYLANYLLNQEELVLNDRKGNSFLVYPFNILLLCTCDNYYQVHACTASGTTPFTQRYHRSFMQQLPPELFFQQGRFYTINMVRFKGVCNDRTSLRFDGGRLINLEHHLPPGTEEIIKQKKRLFHISRH